jgi:hypothetical protein
VRIQEISSYKIADESDENVTRAHTFGQDSKMVNYIHIFTLHTRNAFSFFTDVMLGKIVLRRIFQLKSEELRGEEGMENRITKSFIIIHQIFVG